MPEGLQGPRPWRRLAWQFNLRPSVYCHESWLPPGLSDAVLSSRRDEAAPCHRYLSPWLLSKCALDHTFDLDFDDRLRRMALVDAASLDRLTAALGLLVRGAALRRTLDGRWLARLREASGLDETSFIVMAPPAVVPQGDSEDASLLVEADASRLPELGRPLLLAWASGGREAIGKRLRLKFARSQRVRATAARAPGPATPAQAAWVVEQLLPRVLPQWTTLFS